jgi:UDP-N-acetylmuramate--alanine ligase
MVYGIGNNDFTYQARNLIQNERGGFSFDALIQQNSSSINPQTSLGQAAQAAFCSLQVPGGHNVQNALATLAVAHQLQLPLQEAAIALGEYQGTGRRFDILGEVGGVTVVDDYAHHPSEIRATLSAARLRFPGREIWAVWQPHTYSRTRALLESFCAAFEQADHVLVTEIYAAREPFDAGFSALNVVTNMKHGDVHFMESFNQAIAYLLAYIGPGDVLLVLSAGDADQIGRKVLEALGEDHHRTRES